MSNYLATITTADGGQVCYYVLATTLADAMIEAEPCTMSAGEILTVERASRAAFYALTS